MTQQQKPRKPNKAQVVQFAPPAPAATPYQRHKAVLISFLICVGLPVIVSAWYLWARAQDQYVSVAGFTVRTDEAAQGTDFFGGMTTQLTGGANQSDTDMLAEFLHSPTLALAIEKRFALSEHYTKNWSKDPVFSLHPSPSAEDLSDYWQRILGMSYDQSSRLTEIRVRAFDPVLAQQIARAVLDHCQALLNDISQISQRATMRVAQATLRRSEQRVREARDALVRFQNQSGFIDPQTDLEGRFTIVNALQQKLADTVVLADMLRNSVTAEDPRLQNAQRQAEVIRNRIRQERAMIVQDAQGTDGAAYPDLLARHERLLADLDLAKQSHASALSAFETAQSDALRQNRHLAVYIQPSLAQTSRYPTRWTHLGLIALFSFLGWAVVVLVSYSIRDSRIS